MNRSRDEREPPADGPHRVTPSSDGALGEKRFAVILGARSLVGRYLVRRLAVEGFTGWCLTRGPGPFPYAVPPGFCWRTMREGERMSVPATATLFSLVPLSALPAVIGRICGGGTLIALSSSGAALKAKSSDPEERRAAEAQRRAEDKVRRLCQDRKLVWTFFRPALIYDPGRDRNISVIAGFIRRFGAFPVVWPGLGYRQPIHADDVANAMAAALNAPRARETLFELPGGETLTYRDLVRAIFAALGRRPVLVYLPLGFARAAFRVWQAASGTSHSAASLDRMNASHILDPAPVREILGITCRPFRPEFPGAPARRGDGVRRSGL